MGEPSAGATKTAQAPEDLTGATVGRFVIRARLGSGAMGEVYRAEDTVLKRTVALKRIAPSLQADPYYRARFFKEAERASSLAHSKIAGIFDVLEDPRGTFLVMEYVEGQTLRQRMGQPLGVKEFLHIARQCGDALAAAHEKRIVHSDIKPENIILTPNGDVKVLDFGVAKRLPEASDITSDSAVDQTRLSVGGTFLYMAPEVMLERAIDTRSDLFSLGVVCYEALSGRHPFKGGNLAATTNRILHENPAPLSDVVKDVPVVLSQIVARMLEKNPAARYSTANDLLADLSALERGQSIATAPVQPVLGPLREQVRQHPKAMVVLVVLIIALLALGARLLWRPPVFAARDWIVITEVENRTHDAHFDHDAVYELLRSAMRQSRYVNVVPQEQLIDAVRRTGRSGNEKIDAALGREICQRDNYRAVLKSQVEEAGTGFRINVEVDDPWKGLAVIHESETFAVRSEVIVAVEQIGRKLRNHLGESLAQIEQNSEPLAKVTTPSLEALGRYSRAVKAYAQGDLQRCISLANSAIDADPNFAMAHFYLASAYLRLGNLTARREHIAKAMHEADGVSERERLLIYGLNSTIQGLYDKSVEHYSKLTELYPDDIQGQRALAEAYVWTGHLEDAIRVGQHVLELDPRSPLDNSRLMDFQLRAGHFKDALERFRWCEAQGIRSLFLYGRAGLAYLGTGDTASARQAFEQLARTGTDYAENLAKLYQARVLMYEGRLAEAANELRTGMVLDQKLGSSNWTPVRRYLLGRIEVLQGNWSAARAEARQLVNEARHSDEPEKMRRAGLMAVAVGDLTAANKLTSLLAQLRQQQDSSYTQSCYFNLAGALALQKGQADKATESQKAATLYFPNTEAQLALGDAYASRGAWPDAIREYEKYLQFKGTILMDDFPADWVIAHVKLARAHSRAGHNEEAVRYYEEFLELWEKADANLALVREARKERNDLQKRSF